MDRRTVINDFVNQTGMFEDPENLEFIDKQDLKSMKFHMQASEECHTRAKEAEIQSERERSRTLASWHLFQVDQLLGKYGKSKGLKNPCQQTDDELAEKLFQLSQ
jgi:hypothetical protein